MSADSERVDCCTHLAHLEPPSQGEPHAALSPMLGTAGVMCTQ